MEWQRTFGSDFGVKTMVRTAAHRDDLVECEDRDEKMPRSECTETVDGYFYADPDNVYGCDGCGDLISKDAASDYHGYCGSCYSDIYTFCDVCNGEVARDDVRCTAYECYCEGCFSELGGIEIDVPTHWVGLNDCDETGSLRKFGVELETSEASGYADWLDRDSFGATEDGSINGMEFVSAPLYGDEGLAAIRDFCRQANRSGFDVDDSCGFHLHCDLSDTTPEQRKAIALAYHYTRELWHEFIDCERRDTYYSQLNCGGNNGDHWNRDDIMEGDDHPRCFERYVWVNWNAFRKHSTVEIRAHHATIDGREVCNWVKAHIKFIDAVSKMTVGQVTRTFGNEDSRRQFTELSHIWDDAELSDFYGRKHRAAAAA